MDVAAAVAAAAKVVAANKKEKTMGLMEKLGLSNKPKNSKQKTIAGNPAGQKAREDKIPAAAQDMCCGSCGGRAHTGRKDGKG